MPNFTAYKAALKKQYVIEKTGKHSGFLIEPTSANLRDLCIQILKHDGKGNDRQIFLNFFGFPFDESNMQKLKKETDRFKPLGRFLKNKTEIADSNSIAADMLAVLLDFRYRPYSKFANISDSDIILEEENGLQHFAPTGFETVNGERNDEISLAEKAGNKEKNSSFRKWKPYAMAGAILLALLTAASFFYHQENCLAWQTDHYEQVDCEGYYPIVGYNEDLLKFKKLKVTDTTTFFKKGQPVIWYSKQDNVYEYFNTPGKHPVTQKELRPITTYIIQNQILAKP